MAAGNHQTQKRRFQIFVFYIIGADMPFDMVHADQRQFPGKGDRLRLRHPHQKRPHKSGAVGYRHRVQVIQRRIRLREGSRDDLIDPFHMFSGGNFRHDASIERVEGNLCGNDVASHIPSVAHYRRRRLIAGTLYRKYSDLSFFHCKHLYISAKNFILPQNPASSSCRPFPDRSPGKSSALPPYRIGDWSGKG